LKAEIAISAIQLETLAAHVFQLWKGQRLKNAKNRTRYIVLPWQFFYSIFWALLLEKVTTLHLHTVVGYTAYPHYLPIDELLCRAVKSLCRTYQTSKEHTAPHSRKTPHFPESKWARSAL
jgi:hypothetical protein